MENKQSKKKNSEQGAGSPSRKRLVIILAAVAALAIVAGVCVWIVLALSGRRVDYINDDLSEYVSISPEDYKNFEIKIKITEPGESHVEAVIMSEQERFKTLVGLGRYKTDGEIGIGDELVVRTVCYTKSGAVLSDKELLLDGYTYAVGEGFLLHGSHLVGIDSGLVGKAVENIASAPKTDVVTDADVVYISYKLGRGGSTEDFDAVRIDLSNADVDQVFGEGFRDLLIGSSIGVELDSLITEVGSDTLTYSEIKILAAADGALTLSSELPYDYSDRTLACEEVFVDFYIEKFVDYSVPDLDDAFVKDKLGLEETLADVEGETLTERYRTYLSEQLSAEYESARKELIEEAVWEKLRESVTVKKLPRAEVEERYEAFLNNLLSEYEEYSSAMTLDAFAAYYYDLDGTDLETYLNAEAELAVTEKLTFYYVIRAEGWLPDADAYSHLYGEAVDELLEPYLTLKGCDRSDYATDEEYESAKDTYRREIIELRGEDYFIDWVYLEYGLDRILETVTVNE